MTATARRFSSGTRRLRGDRGSAVAVELPFATLWIFAVAMLVLTIPTWLERQNAANAAAREAARATVTSDSWDQGHASAEALVAETATNHGLDPGDLDLDLLGSLERGAEVRADVSTTIPAISLPLGVTAGSFTYTATHAEKVDLYRSQ